MKTIHEKIKHNEPITKYDVMGALKRIRNDVVRVRKDLETGEIKNPAASEHLNEVLNKIERTLIDETFAAVKRGKTLLDTNLKVTRNQMELGQQHKDIIELKKKLNEVDIEEKNMSKAIEGTVEKIGSLFGLTKGKKIQKRLTTKQSMMLEIIHLDEKLKNPQEQKILKYLILKKYNYMKDEFVPAYFNEIKRNAHITQSTIKERLKSLTERGLLEAKRVKNKVYYYISPKFFTKEAHNVEISIEHMA